MNFTINKLFATLAIITLSATPLGAMATDNGVKQSNIALPPSPPPTQSITVQPAKKVKPRCACCGKVLRKIVRAYDQCIQCQTDCCTWYSDRQADRMEQKMEARGNYLPELCCLTCMSLVGNCYEGGLGLCSACCTWLAAYCNRIEIGTEVTEEMQETKAAQELKLAMLQEKIEQFRKNIATLQKGINSTVPSHLLTNTIATLVIQHNAALIAQTEAEKQEQQKALEESAAYYQSKLTALTKSKED